MAEDGGDKTEDATAKKLQEAHDEGRIPRSQELNAAVLLLGTALVLTIVLPSIASKLLAIMGTSLSRIGETSLSSDSVLRIAQNVGWRVLAILMVVTTSMAGIALGIGAIQSRGVLSTTPLQPKMQRISPMANAKRVLGKQSIIELLKAILKVVIVGIAIYNALSSETIDRMLTTTQQSPMGLVEVIRHYSIRLLLTAGLSYLALAVADYAWQYWQHLQQLRMSKEEVKQEYKNSEGDPLLKQRMRSMARTMARRQMFRDVPKADVVIVNPTHRAIALEYDPIKAPAPIVLAMGQRKVAERIKKIALDHGVPVIENRPLAMALLSTARVGMIIPADLYVAVAEILAFIFRQKAAQGAPRGYQPISRLIDDKVGVQQ